jgi:NADH dehydrogenase
VSLGRHSATVQISHEDDTPTRFYLSGRVAASIKEAVCKGTLWNLRREARKPGSSVVFKGSERDTMPVAAPQVVTNP